jgi:periplasmic protein TonB
LASVLKRDWSPWTVLTGTGGHALDPAARLGVSMAASSAFHLFVLFGITLALPGMTRLKNFSEPLEVVLVNARTVTKPTKADALAQAHLDGGGNTDADRRAKSPLPVMPKESRNIQLQRAAARVQELERDAKQLMTQVKSAKAVDPPEPKADVEQHQGDTPRSENIVAKSLEIARLQAQIDKNWESYQKRPRRTFVGARTQNYYLAQYVDDWRQKIERVGTLNYPEAARREQVFGTLQLTVAINSDGSVEKVEIERSSGKKILDQAALRIVELAGPFAPLPPDIRKTTDILHITRTWIFTRSDQVMME